MKIAHVITDKIVKLYERSTPSNKLSPIAGQVRKEIKELNRIDVTVTANLDLDLLLPSHNFYLPTILTFGSNQEQNTYKVPTNNASTVPK